MFTGNANKRCGHWRWVHDGHWSHPGDCCGWDSCVEETNINPVLLLSLLDQNVM